MNNYVISLVTDGYFKKNCKYPIVDIGTYYYDVEVNGTLVMVAFDDEDFKVYLNNCNSDGVYYLTKKEFTLKATTNGVVYTEIVSEIPRNVVIEVTTDEFDNQVILINGILWANELGNVDYTSIIEENSVKISKELYDKIVELYDNYNPKSSSFKEILDDLMIKYM